MIFRSLCVGIMICTCGIAKELHAFQSDGMTLLRVGDTVVITTPPLNKNINWIHWKVQGKSIILAEKSGDRIKDGYRFVFKAVLPGESVIVASRSIYGKKNANQITNTYYKVLVK